MKLRGSWSIHASYVVADFPDFCRELVALAEE